MKRTIRWALVAGATATLVAAPAVRAAAVEPDVSGGGARTAASISWDKSSNRLLDNPPDGEYSYAPSILDEGNGKVRMWTCHSQKPYEEPVTDHVNQRSYYRPSGRGPSTTVLSPASGGVWDSRHICDPSVVGGDFRWKGKHYSYAMFFLGNNKGSQNNEIGVAFSTTDTGPWVRYPNPIIRYEGSGGWGVGMPSAVSLDHAGKVRLFYTHAVDAQIPGQQRTHHSRWFGMYRDLDLSVVDTYHKLGVNDLPATGLTGPDGSQDTLQSFDVAYQPTSDRYYVVRGRSPDVDGVIGGEKVRTNQLEVDSIDRKGLLDGTGTWRQEGVIGLSLTRYARNHNAGLVRNRWGELPDQKRIGVAYSTSCYGGPSYANCKGERQLYSDRVWEITGTLPN